jgi:hypothetical protein
MIMCEGPEIKDFKCEPSIEHWLLPSERKHHVSELAVLQEMTITHSINFAKGVSFYRIM